MLLTERYNKLFANWFIFCISNSYFFECSPIMMIMRRRIRGWRSRRRRRRTGTLYRQCRKRCFPLLAHDRVPTVRKSYFGAPPYTLRYDKHFFNLSNSQVINKKSAVVENYRLIVTFGYTRLFVLSNLVND